MFWNNSSNPQEIFKKKFFFESNHLAFAQCDFLRSPEKIVWCQTLSANHPICAENRECRRRVCSESAGSRASFPAVPESWNLLNKIIPSAGGEIPPEKTRNSKSRTPKFTKFDDKSTTKPNSQKKTRWNKVKFQPKKLRILSRNRNSKKSNPEIHKNRWTKNCWTFFKIKLFFQKITHL